MSHNSTTRASARAPSPNHPGTQSGSRSLARGGAGGAAGGGVGPAAVGISSGSGAPRLPPKEPLGRFDHNNSSNINNKAYLSLPPSTSSFGNLASYARGGGGSTGRNTDEDLARAVRESVQIRSPSPASRLAAPSSTTRSNHRSTSPKMAPPPVPAGAAMEPAAMPSVNFAAAADANTATNTGGGGGGAGALAFQPGHSYSQSSPDMGGISQSTMPRSSYIPSANPFEDAPGGAATGGRVRGSEGAGTVQPSRQKFSRAMTS